MKTIYSFLALSATLSLSSCAVIVRPDMVPGLYKQPAECGSLGYLQFANIPDTPVAEIVRIKPGDHESKIKVLTDHIRALNEHIVRERESVAIQTINRHYLCDTPRK